MEKSSSFPFLPSHTSSSIPSCRLPLTANLISLTHSHSSLTDTMTGFVILTRRNSFQAWFSYDWYRMKSHSRKSVKLQQLSCILIWDGKKLRGYSTSPEAPLLQSPRLHGLYQDSSNPSCISLWSHALPCTVTQIHTWVCLIFLTHLSSLPGQRIWRCWVSWTWGIHWLLILNLAHFDYEFCACVPICEGNTIPVGAKGGGGKSLGLALLETIAFDSHCLISLS